MSSAPANRKPAPWTWSEQVFLRHPAPIAGAFIALYTAALFFLVAALASAPVLSVTTSDAIAALLALGTLTLAYAAVAQALLAARARRASVAPRLDIEFSRKTVAPDSGHEKWTPIVTSPFFVGIPSLTGEKFRFVLRNSGNGTAVDVKVIGRVWSSAKEPSEVGSQPVGPQRGPPTGYWLYAESLTLKPDGEHEFPLDLITDAPDFAREKKFPYRILRQIVITADGWDVEGRHVQAPPIGLVHTQLIGVKVDVSVPNAMTAWALLAGKWAREIISPIPPMIDEDFVARLPTGKP